MAAGWETNDVIDEKRRNREWILGRLQAPVYDVNDAGTETVFCFPVSFAVTTAQSTVFTGNASTVIGIIHRVIFTNNHSSANDAYLFLVPAATGAAVGHVMVRIPNLLPGETAVIEGPWLYTGASVIQAASGTATGTQVACRLDITELRATTPGVARAGAVGAFSETPTTYYTVPGSGVQDALLVSVVISNHEVAARTVIVELLPSGQSTSPIYYVLNKTLGVAEMEIIGGMVMQPGDAVRVWSTIASANGAMRISVLEFST